MKTLVVGNVSYDTILFLNEPLKNNKNYKVKDKIESFGGSGFTSAILLSTWGVDTCFCGLIGKDKIGRNILEYAKQCELNVDYALDILNETTKNYVINDNRDVINTMFSCKKDIEVNEKISFDADIDMILGDSDNYDLLCQAYDQFPNAIKILNAYTYDEKTIDLCKASNYVICSKEFAEIFTKERIDYNNPETLKEIINNLEKSFESEIIITLGDKGSLYKIDDRIKVMGAIKINEKNSLGAGAIFRGAIAYGIAKKLEIEKCLKIATIASGLSVREIGSTISIPDVLEVYKVYEKNK